MLKEPKNRFRKPMYYVSWARICKHLKSPESIPIEPGGTVRQKELSAGSPGYIGWRDRFIEIDSRAP
jgi:hypothetical protein